jgi:TRAP-type C4-dicarboxylate transport system permease small subunit
MMAERGSVLIGMKKASDALDRGMGLFCGLVFGAMTVVVLVGVFFRYVVASPLTWPEEVSRYLMIWGASAAIALGIKADEHVGLTVIYDGLKAKRSRTALRAVIYTFVLAFQVILFVYSLGMVRDARTMNTLALGITMMLPYAAIPVSMVFGVIQLVLVFILKTSGLDDTKPEVKIIDI